MIYDIVLNKIIVFNNLLKIINYGGFIEGDVWYWLVFVFLILI